LFIYENSFPWIVHILLFIKQVKTGAGISPGKHTIDYADKCQKKRQHSQDVTRLPSTKIRRLILKQERAVTQQAHETLEGVSYQSGKYICPHMIINFEWLLDVRKI
jgi:hypothetical protein